MRDFRFIYTQYISAMWLFIRSAHRRFWAWLLSFYFFPYFAPPVFKAGCLYLLLQVVEGWRLLFVCIYKGEFYIT